MRDLQANGFPERNWPQICTAIQKQAFLRENGLEIEGIDGPPKKQSPKVVVRYKVAKSAARPVAELSAAESEVAEPSAETPEAWAFRLTEKMRGLMKEEFAAYGGGEAFLRWVRGYDEEEA
jgi:hypothetical protein